jgi:hypothetical protein
MTDDTESRQDGRALGSASIATREGRQPRTLGDLVQGLTVMGLLFYALLVFGYDHFYSPLGIRPEEVGLDKVTMLARSAGMLPLILVAIAVAGPIAYLLRANRDLYLYGVPILLAALIAIGGAIWSGHELDMKRNHLVGGYRIAQVRILRLTIFDVRSEPASVTWLGSEPSAVPALSTGQVSYLGQAQGTTVLFVEGRGVVRVPSDDVAVQLMCVTGPGYVRSDRCFHHW